MAKGGKRAGAGRPKGKRNKKTELRLARAASAVQTLGPDAILPIDVMLAAMRHHYGLANAYRSAATEVPDLADAVTVHLNAAAKIAQDAAPYFHSRLTPAPPSSDDHGTPASNLSDLETVRRLAFVLELAARGLLKKD